MKKRSKWVTTTSAHFLLNCGGKSPHDLHLQGIVKKIISGEYIVKRHYTNLGYRPYMVEVWRK